jgi:hypothetical protein
MPENVSRTADGETSRFTRSPIKVCAFGLIAVGRKKQNNYSLGIGIAFVRCAAALDGRQKRESGKWNK